MKSSPIRLSKTPAPQRVSTFRYRLVLNLAFVTFLTAGTFSLPAATYYVATNGNDNNIGSQDSPWQTIQRAANVMTAGDSVNIAAGNYNEIVRTKFNGSNENPISFIASLGVTNCGFVVSNAWQTIVGFNMNGSDIAPYTGIIDVQNAHHLTCVSNILSYSNLTFRPNYLVTYTGAVTNSTWNGNKFLNTPFMGLAVLGSGHLFTNNTWSSQLGGDALRLLCSNTVLTRNTFTNWSDFSGGINPEHADLIQSFSNNGEIATNNLIEGNLFINCVDVQLGIISDLNMLGEIGDWTYRNNIWANVAWQMTINARDMKFYNNTFWRSGTNSGHPFSLSGPDTKSLHFANVNTNTDTITVLETMDLVDGQFVKFIDPDGSKSSHVLPSPLTAYGGANYYYVHVVGQTFTVHRSAKDATNGVNRVDLTTAGSGQVFVTSYYNRNTSDGSRIFNNIFLECGGNPASWIQGWFGVDHTFTNFQAGNNIVKGTGTRYPVPTYGSGVLKNTSESYWRASYGHNGDDPLFLNAAAGDFRLKPGSPAIGAGLSLSNLFVNDFAGALRDSEWDIGAYEYQPGAAPAKPKDLRILQ